MGKHSAPGPCTTVSTMLMMGMFSLGTDGTHGIGKVSLVNFIRVYRLVPAAIRRIVHPFAIGSSAAGLRAAKAGEGIVGVRLAIAHCGCNS